MYDPNRVIPKNRETYKRAAWDEVRHIYLEPSGLSDVLSVNITSRVTTLRQSLVNN